MRKSRFTDASVMSILRQAEGEMAVQELCRVHTINSATFYKWRSKYGGMDTSMIAEIEVIDDEN